MGTRVSARLPRPSAALAEGGQGGPAQRPAPGARDSAAAPPYGQEYLFLTLEEAAFLAAVTARFLPDEGVVRGVLAAPARMPPADAAGVLGLLDRLLARSLEPGEAIDDAAAPVGAAELADRPPLAILFRAAVEAVDRDAQARFGGRTFAVLGPDEQDEILARLEMGEIAIDGLAPTAFFDFLLEHSLRGYLRDPDDEGGRDAEVWRLIGFLSSFSTLT